MFTQVQISSAKSILVLSHHFSIIKPSPTVEQNNNVAFNAVSDQKLTGYLDTGESNFRQIRPYEM